MKIKIEKCHNGSYRADVVTRPGQPVLGVGGTPEIALASLFQTVLLDIRAMLKALDVYPGPPKAVFEEIVRYLQMHNIDGPLQIEEVGYTSNAKPQKFTVGSLVEIKNGGVRLFVVGYTHNSWQSVYDLATNPWTSREKADMRGVLEDFLIPIQTPLTP